jgi:hypothetical protein
MKKSCPACGQPVADETKQFCPKCEKLPQLSDSGISSEDFERLSQHVSERLKGDWKFKAQIAIAVIVLVLAIIGVIDAIVGFNLKENMAAHFQNLEIQATKRINERLVGLDDDVSNTLAQVDVQMRNIIANRFEGSNVQAIIQDVAKVEAKNILESEVQPAVKGFKDDALFIRTIARAQGYDFKAYQSLLEIGNGTNDNAQIANQTIAEIDRSLERDRSDFSPKRNFVIFHGTNNYLGPFTSDELATRFSSLGKDRTSFNREAFINAVGDMKQPLFLAPLIEFFTNETDLGVADRLTIAISALAKEDFHPHDFEQIVAWWHSHQNNYTNWPTSEFTAGQNSFFISDFPNAFQSFKKVLEIDPLADQSRALAVLCGFESGETNKATELSKGFKQSDARWAQYAAAFVELQNGSVSNATVQFANLKKNQPTMLYLPDENLAGWSKIDWQLFHKLTSSEKP